MKDGKTSDRRKYVSVPGLSNDHDSPSIILIFLGSFFLYST